MHYFPHATKYFWVKMQVRLLTVGKCSFKCLNILPTLLGKKSHVNPCTFRSGQLSHIMSYSVFVQGNADYFITSGDKIRFFFEKGVFDDKGLLC